MSIRKKDIIKKMKRQTTKQEKNMCIKITNKGLVTRIHKDSHKSVRKRKRAQKALTSTSENRKSKWPINMKRSSTSLVIMGDAASYSSRDRLEKRGQQIEMFYQGWFKEPKLDMLC